jgi:hypothetical protein
MGDKIIHIDTFRKMATLAIVLHATVAIATVFKNFWD